MRGKGEKTKTESGNRDKKGEQSEDTGDSRLGRIRC